MSKQFCQIIEWGLQDTKLLKKIFNQIFNRQMFSKQNLNTFNWKGGGIEMLKKLLDKLEILQGLVQDNNQLEELLGPKNIKLVRYNK